ncbi:MAG: MarR family transcriptional regulator [Dehalococcoidia bacterium]|nr:MarR family transcriptional regulator [Dehalococcoidia bacterium]
MKSTAKTLPPSPDEIIMQLKKTIRLAERIQLRLQNEEITPAQTRVLFPIIRDDCGYTIQELSTMGGITKGLVSRVIADLEGKGFVERDGKNKGQTRGIKIILSPKGLDFAKKKKAQMHETEKRLDGKITRDDMATFYRVLEVLSNQPV